MKKFSEYITEDRINQLIIELEDKIINAKTPEEIEKFKLELAELQHSENKQCK